MGDGKILQTRTGVFYGFHLQTDIRERVGDGPHIRLRIERIL